MKKIKRLVALLFVFLVITDCNVAQAAQTSITVKAGELQVRELTSDELSEICCTESVNGDAMSPMTTASSYTAYEYSRSFNYELGGTWAARADAKCIVWHYTDGKVHLYNRTITVTRLATYDASRTYGRIVNTDGSLSYTTGDRVHLYGDMATWNFAIDFRVTPTEASFDCYEV